MARVILKNAILSSAGTDETVCIEIVDGMIHSFASDLADADQVDLRGLTVLPGFIDIHNHGAVGIDVNTADAAGLVEIGRFLAQMGVTSWVPTLVPDTDENYRRLVDAVTEVRDTHPKDSAEIVGIHYEGIFSNRKVCGALRPEYFREYRSGDLEKLPSVEGLPHIFTFAPEVHGAMELVQDLIGKGWVPSIGHTDACVKDLEAVYEKGVRQVTHLFNAMTGIHHRELGVAGWALTKEDVRCELIADGIHVTEEILKMTLRARGSENLMLVSDSIAPTGLGDGEFKVWGERIFVDRKGTRNARGNIAGSVITLADASERMTRLGASALDSQRMLSANQARSLGLNDRGTLSPGKKADIVAVDESGIISFIMKSGEVVRSA